MDDLVADGTLHQTEAKLLLLCLYSVLLPSLTTGQTHGGMGEHGLKR